MDSRVPRFITPQMRFLVTLSTPSEVRSRVLLRGRTVDEVCRDVLLAMLRQHSLNRNFTAEVLGLSK